MVSRLPKAIREKMLQEVDAEHGVNGLARAIGQVAQNEGEYETPLPWLHLYRVSLPNTPVPCIYDLSLVITAQGRKQVTLEDEVFRYGAGQALLTTVDLPVVTAVVQAAPEEPYLGLRLRLDRSLIEQAASDLGPLWSPRSVTPRGISLVTLGEELEDALVRLVGLLGNPGLMAALAPLVQHEIVIRLLHGPSGPLFRTLAAGGSPSFQIAKVMNWLKQNFRQDLSMDLLASEAHMSPSTFRQHFRALAGMSPLQYIKKLRLLDARHLMFGEGQDATTTALQVGYESVSQFNREYARLFGEPPARDVRRLRQAQRGV